MALRPAPSGSGVVVRRRLEGRAVDIPARLECVLGDHRATTLAREGAEVSTVEHLLAALSVAGIDDVVIEADAPEIPAFDGSAAAFVALLAEAGATEQDQRRAYAVVTGPLAVEEGERRIAVEPAAALSIDYTIDFAQPAVGRQTLSLDRLDAKSFEREIAPARTFGFLEDVDRLRAAGLACGASLDNTVVVDGARVVNPDGLRFPDEFVRHKALDLIGDLALFGMPIRGRVRVERGGHALHHALVRRLEQTPSAWRVEGA